MYYVSIGEYGVKVSITEQFLLEVLLSGVYTIDKFPKGVRPKVPWAAMHLRNRTRVEENRRKEELQARLLEVWVQDMRRSGILMAVSSVPSAYGIGAFSKEAYQFVDFLKKAGQKLWQILPLGPTGYGDSPYQSFSTYAGNPYYIDLERLVEEGLLLREEAAECDFGSHPEYIDYEKIYLSRFGVLKKAFERFRSTVRPAYNEFLRDHAEWLEDYALYMAAKDRFEGKSWLEWDEDIKLRTPEAMERYRKELKEEIEFYQFQQYEFKKQWMELKSYANQRGIQIVGDIPIYVALDSADTWARKELFRLDEAGVPTAVAGCPPDGFSATGQLWGNPLYNWEYHKKTGYGWWMKRLRYCFELYDIVRIDHFRGFDEYYAIPYGDKTAEYGHWEKGPGFDIFDTMKRVLGDRPVIAEDLGFLTDSVLELVKKTGFPGMKVLQFAFDPREESNYLPHTYTHNCVVYTGTHDNDTTKSWYEQMDGASREYANRYLAIKDKEHVTTAFVRAALASVADTAIIPIQDYLEMGGEARMNTPSTLGDNWKWRLKKDICSEELADNIRNLTTLYGR